MLVETLFKKKIQREGRRVAELIISEQNDQKQLQKLDAKKLRHGSIKDTNLLLIVFGDEDGHQFEFKMCKNQESSINLVLCCIKANVKFNWKHKSSSTNIDLEINRVETSKALL